MTCTVSSLNNLLIFWRALGLIKIMSTFLGFCEGAAGTGEGYRRKLAGVAAESS